MRTFYFGTPRSQGGDWRLAGFLGYGSGPGGIAGATLVPSGALKVVTTKFRPGYPRKNGVPYRDKGVLAEYSGATQEPDGAKYLVVSSTFEDSTLS